MPNPDFDGSAQSWLRVLWRPPQGTHQQPSKVSEAACAALSALNAYIKAGDGDAVEAGRQMEEALLHLRNTSPRTTEDVHAKCGVLRESVAQLSAGDTRLQAFAIALSLEIADLVDRSVGA